jgi:V8-like Glu-specific endopeptidase
MTKVPARRITRGALGLALAGACAAAVPALTTAPAHAAAPAVAASAPGVTADALAAGRTAFGRSATAAQAVTAFWTPERMRHARPAEESSAYQSAARKAAAERTAAAGHQGRAAAVPPPGKLFTYPPAPPVRQGNRPSVATDPDLPSSHPTAATMGKVFFVSNGADFQCSGTVVNTPGGDAVWTAAHCLHTGRGGAPVSNWAFVPAYDSDLPNPEPYGMWNAATLFPAMGWVLNSDMAEDMGVAIMLPNGSGTHIARQVGGQGLTANALLNVTENAFGYPAERPYTGGRLMKCTGASASQYPVWAQTVTVPCTMTDGSSGGGWLLNYDGQYGSLNGINSWINGHFFPTQMASPYFDQTALDLFNVTKNL